jgi:hypothetical protein
MHEIRNTGRIAAKDQKCMHWVGLEFCTKKGST